MIYAYVGKPGTGKTYSMVRIILNALETGRDVYVNRYFYLDEQKVYSQLKKKRGVIFGKICYWHILADLVKIQNGLILIDEAQIWLRSRNWKDLPPEFEYKLQQHRKHGLDMILGVQNIKRIDVVARELVCSVFETKKYFNKLFVCREFEIEEIDKATRKRKSIEFYFLNKKIASCYNTLQEIKF